MGRLEDAMTVQKTNPVEAETQYKAILSVRPETNDAALKEYEQALMALGELYRDGGRTGELAELVKETLTVLNAFAKSKTSKLVRQMIDLFTTIPGTLDIQINITKSCIEWAINERRSFLRQSLEARLVALYLEKNAYRDAIALIDTLLKELKRVDDKMMLVEVQLLESRAYHALRNIAKSRASLSSARTSANAVYCPPLTQAGLDMQSGMLHAEEKDFNTAYSYFIEAMEGYHSQEETKKAVDALKYMLLCKIMENHTDEVNLILQGKHAVQYAGRDLEAMKAIATAHSNRSLAEFEQALNNYKTELTSDRFIRSHSTDLYDNMLEHNLSRVIEPFSRVEISHVAKLVGLDTQQVETKLSRMILDKKLSGVLDQGEGCLIVFEEQGSDISYDAALKTIKKLSDVVEVLYTNQASLLD
ncbi:PCI domain-containing protein [Tricharina praecox]|uniref:PCI domain-containing protein n=1 Tax=Tricharina praecox TaxID=43433 RepID=UPI002220278F|nr:PCI domain-containing protein [Tricharina praecox]KAI5859012.1 PCI domain-containing protein [Tricharina praecox]